MQLARFSTSNVPLRQRLSQWNDVSSAATTPLVADPLDKQHFHAELCHADAGSLKVSEIYSTASIVRHSKRHVLITREPQFLIALQLEGDCRFTQAGSEALLQPGDFALFDNTLPFDVSTRGTHKLLVLGFSPPTLRRCVPGPEPFLGQRVRGDAGLSGLVSQFIRGFWSRWPGQLDEFSLPQTSAAMLNLIAAVYAPPARGALGASLEVIWRVRIRNYIDEHLHETGLTPTRIAEGLRISTRYLHHLFDEDGKTVAKYIQVRRLDECARALADPSRRRRSVTEIGLSYGFNNPSHFSRVFRERYGTTPSEYRVKL